MGTQSNGNTMFDDIISGDRYKGAIDSISWLTALVDKFFIAIISFCGFFIVSIVFLRSAIICLYASYPRLFDNVHEVKQNLASNRGNGNPAGMLMWMLSIFIPDIKSMTDIGDDESTGGGSIDVRSMLMKCFISGGCLILVGTAIYNGYYRDLMGMLSNVGSHIFESYIYSIDLNSAFDSAMEAGSDYEFNYGSGGGGPAKNALAMEVYKSVKNHYGRKVLNSTDDRWIVGGDVENWINRTVLAEPLGLSSMKTIKDGFENPDVVDIKYSVALVPNAVNTSTTEEGGSYYKTFCASIRDVVCPSFQPDAIDSIKDEYLRLSILITPKTSRGAAESRVDSLGGWQLNITCSEEKTNNGTRQYTYYVAVPAGASIPSTVTINSQTLSAVTDNADSKGIAQFKGTDVKLDGGVLNAELWAGMNAGTKSKFTINGPVGTDVAKQNASTQLKSLTLSPNNPKSVEDTNKQITEMTKNVTDNDNTGDDAKVEQTTEAPKDNPKTVGNTSKVPTAPNT